MTCSSRSRTPSTVSSSGPSRRWWPHSWWRCSSRRSRCAARPTRRVKARQPTPRPNSCTDASAGRGAAGRRRRRQSDSAVRHRLENLDGGGTAVREGIGGRLADLLARDRAAEGRPWRVHVDRRAALLPGREQECHLVLVALEPDRHRHAGTDHAIGARRLPDTRVVQDVLQLVNAGFLLALLLLRRVVTAVLAQVTLVPGRLDLLGDLDTAGPGKVVQLGLEPVMRLLGQPGDGVIARLGHGYSSHAVRTGCPPGPGRALGGNPSSLHTPTSRRSRR